MSRKICPLVWIADYFEDEAYYHSVRVDERTKMDRALKVGAVLPELNVTEAGTVGQVFPRLLTFVSFNLCGVRNSFLLRLLSSL